MMQRGHSASIITPSLSWHPTAYYNIIYCNYLQLFAIITRRVYIYIYILIIEGSLEVKLPTIWTVEKQRWEESEEKRSEERRCRCVKHWKSRFTVFFQWFVAPQGRKVGSLKRRVRRHLARWEMKKCTPLWREAHFQVKMCKTHQLRTTFGSWDVEKVHAVVAQSTFPSQNVQNTPASDHFWKLRCRKSARRCGAKHISKSKCTKHHMLGPLLEVQMSKKCRKSARRCGAKHISKSKCTKHHMLGPLLEVQMSKKCRKSARRCGAKHISKSKV